MSTTRIRTLCSPLRYENFHYTLLPPTTILHYSVYDNIHYLGTPIITGLGLVACSFGLWSVFSV